MLRSVKDLRGYTVHATDGHIGKVHDLYFNDQTWTVRHLVVETGKWLPRRRVLVSPVVLGVPKWETRTLSVGLTSRQVRDSPNADMDQPVSHQMKRGSHWPPFWTRARARATARMITRTTESAAGEHQGDLNLRSVREVVNYDVKASDGKVGRAADLIVDDEPWVIRYLVVDTRHLLPGRKVLIAPSWVHAVTWPERSVSVGLSTEAVKDSPEFDPSVPVNQVYETRLYDYYGRPKYWTRV